MTKLTTELLEKFVNDIKTDGMCDITDYQVALALRQLLAYEQAADRPVGEIFRCSGNKTLRWWNDVPEGTVLYAAPVLPKQPNNLDELLSAVEEVLRISDRKHDAWDRAYAAIASIRNGVTTPAQPVMPDEITSASSPEVFEITAEAERLGIRGTYASYAVGWNACRAATLKAQQNEPQNILENIPAQPVGELRARAIALYKPPFKFVHGYVWDADGHMVADNNLDQDGQILRVRGWGRISYLENPEALQDEVGEVIALALSNYWNAFRAADLTQPVSEPYKFPQGYALVPCKLTAENGAKSCMIGKFIEQTEISCPECFGDDECETCDGSGTIEVTAHVSWTTIKDIWAKVIEHFAAAPAHTLSEHSAAIKDVIAERARQVSEEGWTPAHDDQYADCELTQAAICYIDTSFAETNWPWAAEWWKPTNPRRDLVKACALILAEIERMDRTAPAQESE